MLDIIENILLLQNLKVLKVDLGNSLEVGIDKIVNLVQLTELSIGGIMESILAFCEMPEQIFIKINFNLT